MKKLLLALPAVLLLAAGCNTTPPNPTEQTKPVTQNQQQEQPTSSIPAKPSAQKVKDETANWKTYRDEGYNFEFKYPSTMEAKKGGYVGTGYSTDSYEVGVGSPKSRPHEVVHISVGLLFDEKNLTEQFLLGGNRIIGTSEVAGRKAQIIKESLLENQTGKMYIFSIPRPRDEKPSDFANLPFAISFNETALARLNINIDQFIDQFLANFKFTK